MTKPVWSLECLDFEEKLILSVARKPEPRLQKYVCKANSSSNKLSLPKHKTD